jgi:hypothetical protein
LRGFGEVSICGLPPCGDKTAARMGHPVFIPGMKKIRAAADPLRDDKQKDGQRQRKKQIRGFFSFDELRVRMTESCVWV